MGCRFLLAYSVSLLCSRAKINFPERLLRDVVLFDTSLISEKPVEAE